MFLPVAKVAGRFAPIISVWGLEVNISLCPPRESAVRGSVKGQLTNIDIMRIIKLIWPRGGLRRLVYFLRREVVHVPITLTFHVGKFTFTLHIKVKSNNRHSAK